MKAYINTDSKPCFQQAFHVVHHGTCYYPQIKHCTLGEVSEALTRQPLHQHSHQDVYHLVQYIKGRNRMGIQEQLVGVAKGLAILVGPGQQHSFAAHDPGNLMYHEVTFSLISAQGHCLSVPAKELFDLISGLDCRRSPGPVALTDGRHRELEESYERLFYILRTPHPLHAFRTARELCGMLGTVLGSLFADGSTEASGDVRIAAICEYIKAHCGAPLDTAGLAARAGMSRPHFGRRFRVSTGMSPIAYRNALRIEAARNLLCTTSLNNSEIAIRLGFCDAYHFGRSFRHAVGLAPGKYRRKTPDV